jgi:hypothetical protein
MCPHRRAWQSRAACQPTVFASAVASELHVVNGGLFLRFAALSVGHSADLGHVLLVATAVAAVGREFRPGFSYAKAGVVLSELQPASQFQGELDLFSDVNSASPVPRIRTALMDVMNVLNRRFGRDSVRIGSATLA